MMGPLGSRAAQDEEGASSVLVAVTLLLVLLPAAAIAVDLGGMWMMKRNLITDTDAAALAGAMTAVEEACNEAEVGVDAKDYLSFNRGTAPASGSFEVALDCQAETVRVELTDQAPLTFAGVLGYSQLDVTASSTAQFRSPLSFLRPLGVCVGDPIVEDVGTGKQTTVTFDGSGLKKDDALSACGVAAGNWGWLCFGDCTGVADDPYCDEPKGTTGYLRCGVDPGLSLEDPPSSPFTEPPIYLPVDEDCDTSTTLVDDWCETKTGSRNSLRGSGDTDAVEDAYEQGVFPILLFDAVNQDKPRGKTTVHPKGLLWVELNGYCITKDEYGGGMTEGQANTACAGSQFAMQFTPIYVQWTDLELLPDEVLDHIIEVEICSVDNDLRPTTACEQ